MSVLLKPTRMSDSGEMSYNKEKTIERFSQHRLWKLASCQKKYVTKDLFHLDKFLHPNVDQILVYVDFGAAWLLIHAQ